MKVTRVAMFQCCNATATNIFLVSLNIGSIMKRSISTFVTLVSKLCDESQKCHQN